MRVVHGTLHPLQSALALTVGVTPLYSILFLFLKVWVLSFGLGCSCLGELTPFGFN